MSAITAAAQFRWGNLIHFFSGLFWFVCREILTSHISFMLVESVDVALVSSTTSPDNRLARASLRSRPVLKSFWKWKKKEKFSQLTKSKIEKLKWNIQVCCFFSRNAETECTIVNELFLTWFSTRSTHFVKIIVQAGAFEWFTRYATIEPFQFNCCLFTIFIYKREK